MDLHLPTLLTVCVAAVATSAGVMTLYGSTQRTYRGFGWWLLAQWLLALGCVLHLFRDTQPELLPLANLLLLQWPIAVLAGMRHFCSRHPSPVPALLDWLLLALAFLVWLATWAADGSLSERVAAFAGGACVLHVYTAVFVWRMAEARSSAAMRLLVGVDLAAAAVQAVRFAVAVSGPDGGVPGNALLLASGLVIVVSSLVMVYLALMLTNERSESNLRAMHRKLRYLADIDMLTRVPNRRRFHELADQALAAAARPPCALMMFDIDHFKHINDLLGHATGDEALRQVARCVRDSLRTQDVAGRLGGDEFAVLLPETSVHDAMTVASRIVARLSDRQVAPTLAPVSLSFGVVQLQPGETIAEALRRADQALYEAKRQGRSRAVTAFGEESRPVFGESRSLGLPGF
ncbi:GGDEF domain-containing protein [Variovorax sp. YR752]|uniref:GGDEF domain-containing protein n=1 Tax=Variovorax sp. YR752 TaxID=1884383 RepID=UPI0031381ACE